MSVPDGLDVAALTGQLRRSRERETPLAALIEQHLDDHRGYVAWSGGKDSTAVVHLALQVCANVPVCWFDSGLEFPETRTYIHRLADAWNLNLHIIPAEPDALTLLARTGAWSHTAEPDWSGPSLHEALITRPSEQAHARHGAGELIGLRAGESGGRAALLAGSKGRYTRKGGHAVFAPIWNWAEADVQGYRARHQIPENPVYQRLRDVGASGRDLRVGLAFDGNDLHNGRVTWLRRGWPELYVRIEQALPRIREWR